MRRGSSSGLPPITTTTDNALSNGDGVGVVGTEGEDVGVSGCDNQRFSLLSAVLLGTANGGGGAGGNGGTKGQQSQHESRDSDGSGRDSDASDISRYVPAAKLL